VGPLTERERWFFDVHGYLVRRRALEPPDVAALLRAVDALAVPAAAASITSQRFNGHLHTDAAFVALLDHPAVFDVLTELCGASLRLDHTYGIVMSPGTEGLGLHGGGTPFDPAQFYVVQGASPSCGLVAVQWALVDHPAGGGGFACVPGTHKAAFARPAEVGVFDEGVVEVPLGVGDVVIFTEALTHGTRPWCNAHERRTVLYKYSPGSSSWAKDETYSDSLWPMLTARQRLLFEAPYVAYRRSLA
jgi:ectoine hydroxylase-related dioxygenase (phytanoyl-CoA dioxygenase family)